MAIIFDLVGTLIHPNPPMAEVYCQVGRKYGSRLEESQIQDRFIAAFRAACWRDGGDAEHKAIWQRIVAAVFDLPWQLTVPLFVELWNHFAQPTAWAVYPDVIRNWTRLRDGYGLLAIGSNFDSRIEPILRGLDLWIDGRVYWSSRLHASKPEVGFYRAIEGSLQVDSAECLMVGDDLHNDYHGALQAGWSALLIDRSHRIARPGINSISSLDELP